ncbi:hypothetical protein [Streptomyces sp. NBC_00893]|uniref:hypothetical protein n=1 Tax=Streptomyces sp. NBC_00893 TaxID=2975862 RepID=UPI002B1D7093|nr:hypothetical protein [Streptomyces sp. NBC_00893]
MPAVAPKAEVAQYMARFTGETDERGRRSVVRTGNHQVRTVTTSSGAIEVGAPQVNRRRLDEATGARLRFSSKILPPWCRKPPKVTEVLPALRLHGLSTGDFVLAPEKFPGSAAGLSPAHREAADQAVAGRPRILPGPRPVGQRPGLRVDRRLFIPRSAWAWTRPTPASWSSSACVWTAPRS